MNAGITYFEHKGFSDCVRQMRRAGQRESKRAVSQISAIRDAIRDGEKNPFKGIRETKHGESRLKKCKKYDLTGYHRLITQNDKNCVLFLFAGNHDDADKWLKSKKGTNTYLDKKNQTLVPIRKSDDLGTDNLRIDSSPDPNTHQILGKITETTLSPDTWGKLFYELNYPDLRPILELDTGSEESKLKAAVSRIAETDRKFLIYDVLACCNSGDIKGAEDRIRLAEPMDETGLTELSDITKDEILQINDGEDIRKIKVGSQDHSRYLDELDSSATWHEWFLFMHADQHELVNSDHSGPAKLSGVSGSGKTAVAVMRAIRLAGKYPDESIAVITLNRSLAALIRELIKHAASDEKLQKRVKVISFFELCQELLHEFEPKNKKLYNDVTWGPLNEHVDEVFREYYRCQVANDRARVLSDIHRALTALGIDAERYIREEFDWIRSAVSKDARGQYLEIERLGRVYPFSKNRRKTILDGLAGWEEKMQAVGVIDYLGLTTALYQHIGKLEPRYRSIVVDEVQDFGTTELKILRDLTKQGENDIFLCGDVAQQVLPKSQNFADSGIDVPGARSFKIYKNYRNSRQILEAAYNVLVKNLDEAMLTTGEMELLDPDYAVRSGPKPPLLHADTLDLQIAHALSMISHTAEDFEEKNPRDHSACIVFSGFSLYEVSLFGEKCGYPVLDGSRSQMKSKVFFSDLEQTKGYEFDTVVIVNCEDGVLPYDGGTEDEAFRIGCQLYVAMTRAKLDLSLSYSKKPSRWLETNESVDKGGPWDGYYPLTEEPIGRPGYLPEIPDSTEEARELMNLTGDMFCYSLYARGLEADVQNKLAEKVPGRALRMGKHRIEWENVGQLREDLENAGLHGRTGYIFGPIADGIVLSALNTAANSDDGRPLARRPMNKPLFFE